ncbi:hypothetical protein ACSFE6_06885 [Pseudomonas baetica]|uniref:hypothetical protein n=1 Tax=Pseudomonas baetica TaxID=674054 RepID=UPI003EED62E0
MGTSLPDIYLINGNITIFCGVHTEAFKKDILNSSLLGELASISKHSDSREMLWSGYVETVGKIGWITNSREFKRHEFSTTSLWRVIESSAGDSLTKEEKHELLNAFLQLKKPGSQSPAIKSIVDKLKGNTFIADGESNTTEATKASIATSIRLTIVRSNASIITLQVVFKTNNGISIDILDQPILNAISDGKPNTWLLVSSLDARQYDNLRATVIKKIGNHINTDILHVPTPGRLP